MATIRRLKATMGSDGIPGPNAVHYAVAVAPAGNVTAWTAIEAQATDFPEAVARKVADYYEGRAGAGEVTLGGRVGKADAAEVDEAALAHAEQLGQENEELRLELRSAGALVEELRIDIRELKEGNAELAAANKTLTAELAAAQELLNAKE